uniref:Calcium voltage-gated channel auxiliary subunit gamma 1 n=1 Tax=Panthera tigris altaica TaxID=74533 RepID=A0A8C9J799_PANTA
MSQTKAPKVRATLFCILVGVVLAMVAVVTDHWAVLSPEVEHHNATCEAAHFGLWRICIKRIVTSDGKDKTCGPISLPGEKNCSYFRHFNPGETSEIFEVTTQKGLCLFVSVEVTRQSVKRMIDSEHTVWIDYYYSWSFACACAAFVLLFLGGLALLLFSLPRMPQNPWESCMDAEPEH